jgi:hypothetical protein
VRHALGILAYGGPGGERMRSDRPERGGHRIAEAKPDALTPGRPGSGSAPGGTTNVLMVRRRSTVRFRTGLQVSPAFRTNQRSGVDRLARDAPQHP